MAEQLDTVLTVAAFTVMVVSVAAPVCGHQTQPWPLRGLLRGLRALRSPSRGKRGVGAPVRAAERRTEPRRRPVPSWACTQPIDYEGAV